MYKIYVLSSKESQLPYEVKGIINDLSKEIKWKFIGEVDDWYKVTLVKSFNDEKDPERIVEVTYEG